MISGSVELDQLQAIQFEAQRHAGYDVEVIAGVAREKALPKYLRQIIQGRILKLLQAHYGERAMAQLNFLCNGDLRVPESSCSLTMPGLSAAF